MRTVLAGRCLAAVPGRLLPEVGLSAIFMALDHRLQAKINGGLNNGCPLFVARHLRCPSAAATDSVRWTGPGGGRRRPPHRGWAGLPAGPSGEEQLPRRLDGWLGWPRLGCGG